VGSAGTGLTGGRPTGSNVRLFRPRRGCTARCGNTAAAFASPRARSHPITRIHHETYIPAVEDPPRPQSRLPLAHEHGRWPQGAGLAPRQGSRPAHAGLTSSGPAVEPTAAASAPRGTRAYRLRGDRAFEAVFRTGQRYDGRFLQLVAAPAAQDPGRVGFIIGRRAIPRAVDRNRLRRRLRVAVVAARPVVSRFDVILRVRQPVARADIESAADEGALLLGRLRAGAAA
jgi:ribonuclease P protein component